MYKPKILVAEDNEIDQYVILRMLENLGCEVDVVENGFEAVDAVRVNNYDLVVMDQVMPVLNGLEAARIIRELPGMSRLPIVAVSASSELRADCRQAGMNDFMLKPLAQYKFSEMLSKYVLAYSASKRAAEETTAAAVNE